MPKQKERYINTSLAKALNILDLFDGDRQEFSLSELARGLGLRPGSIYPIVYTLWKRGYLERDPDTKKYRLGMKILSQANHILSSLDIRALAKPVLRRVAKELGVSSYLGILYEEEVLYLDREDAAPTIVTPTVVGKRVPAHCTALGKVLLAYQDEVAQRILSQEELPAFTPNTITSPRLLRHELEKVRQNGYAFENEEFHEGNACVAAPVRNYRGKVVAGISLSFAKSRLERDPLETFVAAVTAGALEISRAMGYSGD